MPNQHGTGVSYFTPKVAIVLQQTNTCVLLDLDSTKNHFRHAIAHAHGITTSATLCFTPATSAEA
jgi:hypothetical protein